MKLWKEIRTALYVARCGTLSGAAKSLGTHRATVLRHIKALESHYGIELFQRHPRGYKPTRSGQELLRVARATEQHFDELGRTLVDRRSALEGDLVLTTIAILARPLMPAIAAYRHQHPQMRVHFIADYRLLRLDYGEADIAIRQGPIPHGEELTAKPLAVVDFALFAHRRYVEQHGLPNDENDFDSHHFIGVLPGSKSPPMFRSIDAQVPKNNFILRGPPPDVVEAGLLAGIGITWFPVIRGRAHPNLVQVGPVNPEWQQTISAVTHTDCNHRPRIQAFLSVLDQHPLDFESIDRH